VKIIHAKRICILNNYFYFALNKSENQNIMRKIYLLTSLILFCCAQMVNAQPYQSIFGNEKRNLIFLQTIKV